MTYLNSIGGEPTRHIPPVDPSNDNNTEPAPGSQANGTPSSGTGANSTPPLNGTIQQAQQGVDDALKQVQAAQQALRLASANTPASVRNQLQQALTQAQNNLTAKVEAEIQARSGLPAGEIPDAGTVQKYGTVISQRYASHTELSKPIDTAVVDAREDLQAQSIVRAAQTQTDPGKALAKLSEGYASAPKAVQQRILASSGAQAIIAAVASTDTAPLGQVSPGGKDIYAQDHVLEQTLQNLDQSAAHLDPALAAALVDKALPQIERYNTQYAARHGGQELANDVLHTGPATVDTVMSLSGRIADTTLGDQDIARLAKLGFWDNTSVRNALATGASAAYPEAIARQAIASGQDPTNVIRLIQEGVQLDEKKVKSDLTQLAQHNQELYWLTSNLGGSMSPSQLKAAIANYENHQDPSAKNQTWLQHNQELAQQVVTDATTLTQNLESLSALAQLAPQAATTLNVQGTITGAVNDKTSGYALAIAAQNNPSLYLSNKGQSFLNLLSTVSLGSQGRKTAQLIGWLALRNSVKDALDNVTLGPNAQNDAKAALDAIKAPWALKLVGVNAQNVKNSVLDSLDKNLPSLTDSPQVAQQKLSTLYSDVSEAFSSNFGAIAGKYGIASGAWDLFGAVRAFGGIGEQQDTVDGVLGTLNGLGNIASGASQFPQWGIYDSVGEALFDGAAGGAVATALGAVGVGLVTVAVLGTAVYQQYKAAHQYQGASQDFLRAGGYSPAAAKALSSQDGLLSGASGTSGMPFLQKYAQMKHLSTAQLQNWVNNLSPAQMTTLDKILLQTAGDSHGDVGQFTDGPPQSTVIYGEIPATITLANTLGVFESNLRGSGIPLPP